MLHVFELGWDDHAVVVTAIAGPDADQLVRLRVDEGDAALQALKTLRTLCSLRMSVRGFAPGGSRWT